jgi:hypothetical protein
LVKLGGEPRFKALCYELHIGSPVFKIGAVGLDAIAGEIGDCFESQVAIT